MSRRVVTVEYRPDGSFYAFLDEVVAAHGARGWSKVRSYTTPDGRRLHDITLTFGGSL